MVYIITWPMVYSHYPDKRNDGIQSHGIVEESLSGQMSHYTVTWYGEEVIIWSNEPMVYSNMV